MKNYSKSLKAKLEAIPGVSINLNRESKAFQEAFRVVSNNLNFFTACMDRVTTSLKNTHKIILHLEEFYRDKMDSSHYESELEVFQIIIDAELLKIVDIHKSTKYKGIPLLDCESKQFISKEKLLIDVFSNEKFEIDFSTFNLDISSDLIAQAGINLGAKNKLASLTLLAGKEAIQSGLGMFKRSFFNDFEFYRFNIERMLDKAFSITATLESKKMMLSMMESAFLNTEKSKSNQINFTNLNKHLEEDSKKIAQYV